MKPYTLLIILFFSGIGIAAAQQRTRDVLFPSFEQDLAALKKKESNQQPPASAKDRRPVKEQLFTDYRPQSPGRNNANTLKINRSTGIKNPSDMSSEEAAQAAKARQLNLPAPTVPTQGSELAPLKSGPVNVTTPVKALAPAPATAPVKQAFGRKKP